MAVRALFLIFCLAAVPARGQSADDAWKGYSVYRSVEGGLSLSRDGLLAPNGEVLLPEAVAWLPEIAANSASGPVTLYWHDSHPEDRYGRREVEIVGSAWLQEDWLKAGRTFLLHGAGSPEVAARLKTAEVSARRVRRGLWARDLPVCHGEADAALGTYTVVQGRVLEVGAVNGQTFLNFGPDRRTDFTIRVENRNRRDFGGREGLAALKGRLIEARGFLYRWGGAMMDLYRTEDLEILDNASDYRLTGCS